jgi:nucleoside-diphosphate-sugar epimerase
MKNTLEILIIGGTRNLGHMLALDLLEAGHDVTVLNRGRTLDELPGQVLRLRGDRGDPAQLARALEGRSFDAVVDTTLYNGADAKAIVELLDGRTGHYIFLSTGQVYLVREGLQRPFVEDDYDGPVMSAPPAGTFDHEQWIYGAEKRQAEDILSAAWQTRRFPFTSLRMPMVNSQRDHYERLRGYLLRLKDGGPILIPAGFHFPLRHVYGADVVRAIAMLIETGLGKGRSYNISQDETLPLRDFLEMLAGIAGCELRIAAIDPELLRSHGLLPDCSPFSSQWMSELDNRRSKQELGMQYTPLPACLRELVAHYEAHPSPPPAGYRRRQEEIALARHGLA